MPLVCSAYKGKITIQSDAYLLWCGGGLILRDWRRLRLKKTPTDTQN